MTCSRMLRPIGQALERLGIQSFFLSIEAGEMVVRVRRDAKPQQQQPGSSIKALWRLFFGGKETAVSGPPSGIVELRYTSTDIARLEAEGRAKRRPPPPSTPEAHSVSQILRVAGSFVDQKNGRLLAMEKDGSNINIHYQSALGENVFAQFTVSELYDLWVKMYLRRGRRSEADG